MPTRKTVTPFSAAVSLADIDSALHDQIATRAFELYLERGGEDGHDIEDWLRAEREILAASPAAAIA